MDETNYIIQQSSGERLWLLNYRPSGCREFLKGGEFKEFYTCLWGNCRQDAHQFTNRVQARVIAKEIGGCVVVPARKGESR